MARDYREWSGRGQLTVHFGPKFLRRYHKLAAPGDHLCLSRRTVFEQSDQPCLRVDDYNLTNAPLLVKTALAQYARERIVGRKDFDYDFKGLVG